MTFQPPYRPSGRSVWLGKDLVRTDDWIVRLSPATLEEIDAAVSRLRRRNAYDTPVAREEFPLTTMADDLARMRQEIAIGRGFFVFRGLDRDRYSNNELGLIFRGASAPISATSSRKARSATAWAISATSAIFWPTAASGAAISQAASRPRTPTRAGRSASSPCSA
jgi:hypothetical protein